MDKQMDKQMDKDSITEVGKDSERGKYSVWEASVDEGGTVPLGLQE